MDSPRMYTVHLDLIGKNGVKYGIELDDGFAMLRGVVFDNERPGFVRMGGPARSVRLATCLQKAIEWSLKQVELENGLTFELLISKDEYERPEILDTRVEVREKNGKASKHADTASAVLNQ